MDNISVKWLPENLDTEANGSHNGYNYIAYSFYVVNGGNQTINYWYELDIDDVIKDVDEAIRIMVYKNGKTITYAKKSRTTGKAEIGMVPFKNKTIVFIGTSKRFKPKSRDHYTIVVWIEGNDLECNNELLGGEMKMHMDIKEEHIKRK